jgi:hypothetical protein
MRGVEKLSALINASEQEATSIGSKSAADHSTSLWAYRFARILAGCGLSAIVPLTVLVAGRLAPAGLLNIDYRVYLGFAFFGVVLGMILMTSEGPADP